MAQLLIVECLCLVAGLECYIMISLVMEVGGVFFFWVGEEEKSPRAWRWVPNAFLLAGAIMI